MAVQNGEQKKKTTNWRGRRSLDGTGGRRTEKDEECNPRVKMRTYSEAGEKETNCGILAEKGNIRKNRETQNGKGQGTKSTKEEANVRSQDNKVRKRGTRKREGGREGFPTSFAPKNSRQGMPPSEGETGARKQVKSSFVVSFCSCDVCCEQDKWEAKIRGHGE